MTPSSRRTQRGEIPAATSPLPAPDPIRGPRVSASPRLCLPRFLLALVLGAGLACNDPSPRVRWGLEEVPPPAGLDEMTAPVREAYAGYRDTVDRLLGRDHVTRSGLGDAYGQLGMWYHAYDFLGPAAASYRNAAILVPDDARWPYLEGHVYRDQGRTADARAAFQRALAAAPGHVPARLRLADVDLEEGLVEEAGRRYEALLAESPANAVARFGLGRVALARQDYAAAVPHLEAALADQPEATDVLHALGLAYRGLGDLERAASYLNRALTDFRFRTPALLPDDPIQAMEGMRRDARFYAQHAQKRLQEGRIADALAAYRTAIDLEPENVIVRINLGGALLVARQFDEALAAFDAALRLDPGNAQGHFGRAAARSQRGDTEGAEADYRSAIAAEPDYMEAHFNLGTLLRTRGQPAEALGALAEALRIDPANTRARYRHGETLIALQRFTDARRTLETGLTIGADANVQMLLARLLATAPEAGVRDGREALRLARAGFQKQGDLAYAETVAMAYAEVGDWGRAVAWQEAAVAAVADASAPWVRQRLDAYRARTPLRTPAAPGEHPMPTRVLPPPSEQ